MTQTYDVYVCRTVREHCRALVRAESEDAVLSMLDDGEIGVDVYDTDLLHEQAPVITLVAADQTQLVVPPLVDTVVVPRHLIEELCRTMWAYTNTDECDLSALGLAIEDLSEAAGIDSDAIIAACASEEADRV